MQLIEMSLRRSSKTRYLVAATVVVVAALLYCECFVYMIQPYYWNKLDCKSEDRTCVKVLFVADPQIQGDYAVPPPLSYLLNWDSDKYLKSTFQIVLKEFKPEVIVYLGDLMDEGSISTIEQFHNYAYRLSGIFDINYPVVQVWLPGDNDIGGENEPIRKNKIREFQYIYHQPDVVHYRNLSFYKVNGITHQTPKEVINENFKIVVSHFPITVQTYFGQLVNNAIRPNIYFCAHDHDSKYVIQSRSLTFRETKYIKFGDKVLDVAFDTAKDEMYEIYVPTCSYRMGTSKIGYGAAVFENYSQNMSYTVFWSPQRFPYLVFYLIIIIVLVTYYSILYSTRVMKNCATLFCRFQSKRKTLKKQQVINER